MMQLARAIILFLLAIITFIINEKYMYLPISEVNPLNYYIWVVSISMILSAIVLTVIAIIKLILLNYKK